MSKESLPIQPYIRPASINGSVVIAGGKIWIKNHELPPDPRWNHFIVYEYPGKPFEWPRSPGPVLGMVAIDRSIPHTTIHTSREASFSQIRAALLHVSPPPPDAPKGGSEGGSTTLGNGNGATPTFPP